MIYMAIESVLFIIMVLVIDSRKNNPSRQASVALKESKLSKRELEAEQRKVSQEDSDVHRERLRVYEGRAKHDRIILDSLRKAYLTENSKDKKVALKSLSLGIPEGECFGYLGVNGAGMSSIFIFLFKLLL